MTVEIRVSIYQVIEKRRHRCLYPHPVTEPGGEVSFVPAAPELHIVVRSWQAGGDLVVRVTGESAVRVSVTSGHATEELVVLPGTVEIANGVYSTTQYVVEVPAELRQVRLSIAGTRDTVLWTGSAPAGTFRFSLERRQDQRRAGRLAGPAGDRQGTIY